MSQIYAWHVFYESFDTGFDEAHYTARTPHTWNNRVATPETPATTAFVSKLRSQSVQYCALPWLIFFNFILFKTYIS
jgi:hypothetical protein